MAFTKETGKQAGIKSKRGASKEVKELREFYNELLEANRGKLQNWFDEVGEKDPAKAIELLLKISAFVLPKFKQIDLTTNQPTQYTMINLGDGLEPKEEPVKIVFTKKK